MTETSAPAGGEPQRKRRRWPWVVGILAVLLLSPVAFWVWADRRADALLEAEIQRCRDAGEPIDLEDFDSKPVPPDQDAARALRQAAEAMRWTKEEAQLALETDPRVAFATRPREAIAFLDAHVSAFALVRSARTMGGADWGVRMRTPARSHEQVPLAKLRALSLVLRFAAICRHLAGDDTAAVECVRDILTAARIMEKAELFETFSMGLGDRSLASGAVEIISKDLAVLPDSEFLVPGPATWGQVKALIAELLDEASVRHCAQGASYADRAVAVYMIRHWPFRLGDYLSDARQLGGLFLEPWGKAVGVSVVRRIGSMAAAFREADLPAARRAVLPIPDIATSTMVANVAGWMPKGLRSEPVYKSLVATRMAATALAIRLYEIDHGRRPERLGELVPDYLSAVPDDPMDARRKISYLPKANRPLLYSVGENGTDEGGAYAANPEDPPESGNYDLPFFLNGDRPRKGP